ncbi:MAG: hypothetical protein JWO46_1315 [Nocardioidaceae bacterium]|nr:hypothetical protein [Nocardioidaceae bacterium]
MFGKTTTKLITGLLLTLTGVVTVAPAASAAPAAKARRAAVTSLAVTPTVAPGQKVTASGKVSSNVKRPVQLQLAAPGWTTVASARTTAKGRFTVTDPVVRTGSYRVVLPRVRVHHRTYAKVVSATRVAASPNELASGAAMVGGQVISSADKVYDLTMTADGNLTLTRHDTPDTVIWSTATGGHPGGRAVMQYAGNLVVVDAANVGIWSAGTSTPGARLQVRTDGTVAIVSGTTTLWTSTGGLVPVPAPSTSDALTRAASWVAAKVKYSQSKYFTNAYGKYRTDCSGYVSMAWALTSSYTTRTLGSVSHPITAAELTSGDILLSAGRHVVLFDAWANPQHTSYWGYEESPSPGATHRVIPYPYFAGNAPKTFLPYRKN